MRLLFTLILCLRCLIGNAQYQERSASLTNRNDETTQGYVRDYDWDKNPQSIEFAGQNTRQFRTIAVRSVKRLSIDGGQIYEGLFLNVPYYAKAPITVGNDRDLIRRIDSTYYFAELLLESDPVKLYRFFDADDKVRFVLTKYDSLVVLNDIHVLLSRREHTYNYDIPEYRTTLKAVLSECPTLNTETTVYTETSLINLLKEYLSFCRIDSKIHVEQKKLGKIIIGAGGFGSFLGASGEYLTVFGISGQVLFPKRFHNGFALIDLGRISLNELSPGSNIAIGLYGGRYFGRRAIQGKIYTGLSTMFGPFDTGVGISYRKIVSAELRYPVLAGVLSGGDAFSIPPLLNVRAIVPLTRREPN